MATTGIRSEPPLVVIVGPTASGKTSLAIEVARQFDGEIICADSRTVYKEMDIGTAKPMLKEQGNVPHWGLDLVSPNEVFSVAAFQTYATQAIADIRSRGKVPILVGGTGLYIDSVIYGFEFGIQANKGLRDYLESYDLEKLRKYCLEHNIKLSKDDKNKRRIIRAIETKGARTSRNLRPHPNTIIVGIATDRKILQQRILIRAEQFFEGGVVEEAKKLGDMYGWDTEAISGNIYPLIHRYLEGEFDLETCKRLSVGADMRLAKKQMTWFRRDPHIVWGTQDDVTEYISSRL